VEKVVDYFHLPTTFISIFSLASGNNLLLNSINLYLSIEVPAKSLPPDSQPRNPAADRPECAFHNSL
jgi:hypothetical protein